MQLQHLIQVLELYAHYDVIKNSTHKSTVCRRTQKWSAPSLTYLGADNSKQDIMRCKKFHQKLGFLSNGNGFLRTKFHYKPQIFQRGVNLIIFNVVSLTYFTHYIHNQHWFFCMTFQYHLQVGISHFCLYIQLCTMHYPLCTMRYVSTQTHCRVSIIRAVTVFSI